MEKKLPGVFANKISKDLNNNDKVYYSKNDLGSDDVRHIKQENNNSSKVGLNINQKINNIFNSPKYVYKADVHIVLKNGDLDCRIIGRNPNHLITMDNKLIAISDIEDIYFSEK